MERRLALATAGAVAATLGIGTVCFAALGGGHLLGLSGDGSSAAVVPGSAVEQVTKVVVVRSADGSLFVVESTATASPEAAAPAPASPTAEPTLAVMVVGTAAPSPAAATTATPTPTTTTTPTRATTPSTSRPVTTTSAKPVTTTSAAPVTTNAPSTSAPPTTPKPVTPTTTARPPGVPADWPAGKPIPPMPAGCKQPQLELNGVWNCDD